MMCEENRQHRKTVAAVDILKGHKDREQVDSWGNKVLYISTPPNVGPLPSYQV